VFGVLAFAHILSQFLRHANAAIAPEIAVEFGLSAAAMGLMTSLFYVMFASAQIPLGYALDVWRPRYVMAAMMMASVAGCALFATAGSYAALAVGRAMMGAGMAVILMGSMKILSRWFGARRFATASGMLVGVSSFGGLLAASPLVSFAGQVGWRAAFWVAGGMILLVGAVVALLAKDAPKDASTMPVDAFAVGPDEPASSSARGGAGTEAERSVTGAKGYGRVLRSGAFWRLTPLIFFLAGSLFATQGLWGGLFVRDVLGVTGAGRGTYLTVMALGVSAGYFLCGYIADRFGVGRVILIGASVFLAANLALVAATWIPSGALVLPVYGVFGFSGAVNVLLLVQAGLAFPAALTGRAISGINMFGIGGAALVQYGMGVMIALFPRDTFGAYPPSAYRVAFLAVSAGIAVALAAYVPLARQVRPAGGR
jgi:sugar phosphate permease